MQQRPSISLFRAAEENSQIKEQPKYCSSPRRTGTGMEETAQILPLYLHSSSIFRRSAAEKLVHLIPFLVLFCLLTLWWFSYPVNLVMKDGKIIAIHHLKFPQPADNNHVELAILASAISPVAPLPDNLTSNFYATEEAVHLVNKTD